MSQKRTAPLFSIMTMALVLSFLLNTILLIQSYRRNIVVAVPDGDSLQMADGRRVRLLGIDAPERGMCMAAEARDTLESAIKGRHVRLKNIVTDDYGRQLAHVIIEDFPTWVSYIRERVIARSLRRSNLNGIATSQQIGTRDDKFTDPYINRLMVSRGLARFGSAKSEYYDTLKTAQTHAKENMLGIWSEICRKTSNPDCDIKGNIRAGKKTFLLPGCKNYDQTIIDESYGDQWFCTEDEAMKAGFSSASGCSR